MLYILTRFIVLVCLQRTDPRAGIAGGVGYLFDETGPIRTLALGTAWLCAGPPDTSHGIRSGEPEVTDASGKKVRILCDKRYACVPPCTCVYCRRLRMAVW